MGAVGPEEEPEGGGGGRPSLPSSAKVTCHRRPFYTSPWDGLKWPTGAVNVLTRPSSGRGGPGYTGITTCCSGPGWLHPSPHWGSSPDTCRGAVARESDNVFIYI